jgi:predicted lipoprotein with Yx(FWY)xxD motif
MARPGKRFPARKVTKLQKPGRSANLFASRAVDRSTKPTQGAFPMRRSAMHRLRSSIQVALLAGLLAALLAPAGAGAKQATKLVAKEAQNANLGKTILTTVKGRTLYSLSAETNGKFICTGSCASTWRPLLVPAGVKPKGPVKLGTIKRPDGKTQVTYKGRPLYSFSGDSKAGEFNGEGIKDVGTWHVAATGKLAPTPEPQPQPPPYPY